ncbi:hypothetical protein PQG02_23650 [Nostoc sp. UHCC 0926]|uniref:hypothetical protein n=1 Tax=unclassified Nostoc TaxID=2593658 RepID=UPI00236187F9|nr:hypothetical protein [Nostoc sp. UHCC 0926]WDD31667.1 hypothetical protein PQG02_23650 [Nostoc sp. UHCC 0926]
MLTPSVATPNFSQIHSPQNLILPEIVGVLLESQRQITHLKYDVYDGLFGVAQKKTELEKADFWANYLK